MSSESDEEDFAAFGTPLDPLEEDAIPKKRAVTVEDQVAKDKHGRRRFHGAFTGGFSAGFFNSVGSLEGWKPTQFKSSRSSKANSQLQQRAEDFMDDEDMDEFGFAPKMLRPTGNYNQAASEGPSRKRLHHFPDGPIPGIPVLRTLVEPVRETIGLRLMKQMGWRPGQGVGPRLSKTEKSASRKWHKSAKLYGCALPSQDTGSDAEGSEDDDTDVTFAPDDYEPYIVRPKVDCFGLGYKGLDRRPVLSTHVNLFDPVGPSLVMQEKKKKVSIRGQAFGVGAFEKEDEDIYASEDMSQYDFALDTPRMLAEKRKQERNSRVPLSTSSDVIEGFELWSQPVCRKCYPPPLLPQGFSPNPPSRQSRFNTVSEAIGHSKFVKLTVDERAVLVNEPSHPNQLSEKQLTESPLPVEIVQVERTSESTFRPFVADPEKQIRYEKYLTLSKLGQTDKLKSLQPFNMTEWEQERERSEFEQAARLYRPLSAAFSDRFVSASVPDDSTDPLAPVSRTVDSNDTAKNAAKHKMYGKLTRSVGEWSPHSVLCKRFNIPQPGCSSVSQTKSSRPKFSVFNFLDAAPFNTAASSRDDNKAVEVLAHETDDSATKTTDVEVTGKSLEAEVKTTKEDDLDKLIDSTNKMDLYKAIFLSSDESENEDDTVQTIPEESKKQGATELNVLRNSSPPRGIFANLDFDQLNTPEKKTKSVDEEKTVTEANNVQGDPPPGGIFTNIDLDTLEDKTSKEMSKLVEKVNKENFAETELNESGLYGPALPNLTTKHQRKPYYSEKSESSESENDWVEVDDSSESDGKRHSTKKKHSKKSHRKSKKHKEKKHKRKKKRK